MLEDTTLMDSYCNLIWIMLAFSSKTWKPDKKHIQWLLGVVHNMCEVNETLQFDKNDVYRKELYLDGLTLEQQSIIYSLQIRKSYGGMKCDMEMIQSIINQKMKEFKQGGNIKKLRVRRVSVILKYLPFKNYELSGVDFHCVSIMLEKIKEKYPRFSLEDLKKIIWKYRSGINIRTHIPKENNDFKTIKTFVDNYSYNILKKL